MSASEAAWLIEFLPFGPLWFSATDAIDPWTKDSANALRFSRKEDAEAMLSLLQALYLYDKSRGTYYHFALGRDCYAVKQHIWLDAAIDRERAI